MKRLRPALAVLLLLLTGEALPIDSPAVERLVFGSFHNPGNAENWANRMTVLLNVNMVVVGAPDGSDGLTYRVVTVPLEADEASRVRRIADSRQLRFWRLLESEEVGVDSLPRVPAARASPPPVRSDNPQRPGSTQPPVRPTEVLRSSALSESSVVQMFDVDLSAQSRTFFEQGLDGQSTFHPSMSITADYYRAWDDERQSLTFTPFYRYDAEDDQRTHFDIREGFWSLVGNDWDLHLGVKQVFWGVTEFNHLVDIINQTDQVESLDGEDRLGQPMAHLSLVRNWGILDFHLLTGFRERTFAGVDGRPRFYIPVDTDDVVYESAAGDRHIDGAIRWSHHVGAFEFGLYHFYGTSRAPLYNPITDENGEPLLQQYYPIINQTGLDTQAIYGDWAFKLEAISRTNFPDSYYAITTGFERTLVGAFGSRADLGLVFEYFYDERGDAAFDTFFEHDMAVATRWALNDLGDTQALIGVIWDYRNHETIFSVEASRRLGETWTLLVEGRAFTDAAPLDADNPFDPANKGASVARDDYIELELTKYF